VTDLHGGCPDVLCASHSYVLLTEDTEDNLMLNVLNTTLMLSVRECLDVMCASHNIDVKYASHSYVCLTEDILMLCVLDTTLMLFVLITTLMLCVRGCLDVMCASHDAVCAGGVRTFKCVCVYVCLLVDNTKQCL